MPGINRAAIGKNGISHDFGSLTKPRNEAARAPGFDEGHSGINRSRHGFAREILQGTRIFAGCPQEHVACEHQTMRPIVYKVETEVETDGRWIAEITDLPGVLAYGSTEKEAVASAQALALRVLANRIGRDKAEWRPGASEVRLSAAKHEGA